MPNAAILGCGPSALFTALACRQSGYEIVLFSTMKKSTLHGAQYLTSLPDKLDFPVHEISVEVQGTVAEYGEKIGGFDFPPRGSTREQVYDIRLMYDILWNQYCGKIIETTFTRHTFGPAVQVLVEEFDIVFSSIPLADVCENKNHTFEKYQTFVSTDDPNLGTKSPVRPAEDTVIYAGGESPAWFRASNLFGYCSVEWPALGRKKPPLSNVVMLDRPIRTDCTCFPSMVRIGHDGEWTQGVSPMDAYGKAKQYLESKGVQGALF